MWANTPYKDDMGKEGLSFFENSCIVVYVFVRYSLTEITRRITCLVWHHIDLHFRCWMGGYPNTS